MSALFKAATSAALAGMLLGATPTRAANPMQLMSYLIGRWNCSSYAAGQRTTYTATYSYALGGTWLRTINRSKNSTSEDMMTYGARTWRVIDMEPTGMASVLEGPDTGLAHIAMKTAYPKRGLNVTYDRVSMSRYTLTFSGTLNGKPAKWIETCTKQ